MIFDKLENHKNYRGINTGLDEAFDYLVKTDLNLLETGRHIIKEEEIYAVCMIYETKAETLSKNEAHKKYIDVQYVVSGVEKLFSSEIKELKVLEEYAAEKDVMFYENKKDCEMLAKPGYFAVFFPEDAHMPGVNCNSSSEKVKKVVVKVHV